jgi:hypothetical protein
MMDTDERREWREAIGCAIALLVWLVACGLAWLVTPP